MTEASRQPCALQMVARGVLHPTMRYALWLCAGFVICGCLSTGDPPPKRAAETFLDAGLAEPCMTCEGQTTCTSVIQNLSAAHVEIDITSDPPPAGGDHNSCWATYGIYNDPLAGQYWLHNLEHGAVVYLYNCPDGCADDIATLESFVTSHPRTLLTAYPYMTTRFAILSWGRRLLSDCLDPSVVEQFYEDHVDRAPESIESGPPSGCPRP